MRLKEKLMAVLEAYLGKDYIDFQDSGRDLVFLVNLAGELRIVHVYFPTHRPVLFIIDFGFFPPDQAECIEVMCQGSEMSARIGRRGEHLILAFEQLLNEASLEHVVAELVQLFEDDIGEMDDLILESTTVLAQTYEHDEDGDTEESEISSVRQPRVVFH